MNLAEMRAERDRLDAEIDKAERAERENWNQALDECTDVLNDWMHEHGIEVSSRERENEVTWDVGLGALEVTFGYDDGEHARSLRMISGRQRTLTLEWNHVPDRARLLAIVAVVLNRPLDAAEED